MHPTLRVALLVSATAAILLSLEVFQQSPKDFYPYDSRYDAWLRHKGELTAREQRGLSLFNDPKKGNCASCHPNQIRQGAFPQFTDFGYAAVGLPRNKAIPANADRHYYDLGLCGPLRTDLQDKKEYCGMFRTPTLRNVATRRVFFHIARGMPPGTKCGLARSAIATALLICLGIIPYISILMDPTYRSPPWDTIILALLWLWCDLARGQ